MLSGIRFGGAQSAAFFISVQTAVKTVFQYYKKHVLPTVGLQFHELLPLFLPLTGFQGVIQRIVEDNTQIKRIDIQIRREQEIRLKIDPVLLRQLPSPDCPYDISYPTAPRRSAENPDTV